MGSVVLWNQSNIFDFSVPVRNLKPALELPGDTPYSGGHRMIYSTEFGFFGVQFKNAINIHCCKTGKLISTMHAPPTLGSGSDQPSCLNWDLDFAASSKNSHYRKPHTFLIIMGDKSGRLCMWNALQLLNRIEDDQFDLENLINKPMVIAPFRVWQAHTGEITCIDIDAFKISSAGLDGFIRSN